MSLVVGANIMTAMYFSQMEQKYVEKKFELDKYLKEGCERYSSPFDILNWWKVNSSIYLTLSSIARDILAMPISTVASKFTFNMGSRVLDVFCSSLNPMIVEALLCTQDWL